MYLDHFGLNEPPFKITPHIEFFYQGANRGAILEGLLYAIQNGEGLIKVVGEVGAGKTMLSRVAIERLPPTVHCILINTPSISREDILALLAEELGINITGQRHTSTIRALQECLIERYATGHQVVLFIDEAHAMPQETLEEIRLLSNLESSTHKLLQIVLFGQPELDEMLARPDMRQLRERVTHSFNLGPLHPEDVRKYLDFRLRAAGYKGPELFSPASTTRLAAASRGLTRRINILADKTLLAAFADSTHTPTEAHVDAAIRDSEFGQPTAFAPPLGFTPKLTHLALALGTAMLIGASTTYLLMRPTEPPVPAAHPTSPPSGNAPSASTPLPASYTTRIDDRLAAGKRLLASKQLGYTLLLSVTNPRPNQMLEDFLAHPPVNGDKLYLYETSAKGSHYLAVIFDIYPSLEAAQKALKALPEEIQRHQPYVRSLGKIREEIRTSL